MTIYTYDTQLGTRSSSGIFTVGTRYGGADDAPPVPQEMYPEYHAWHRSSWGAGSGVTVTPIDYWSWSVVGTYSYYADVHFKVTVLSGSYGDTSVDAEIEAYAGSDGTSCISVLPGDPLEYSGYTPTLTDGTSPSFGIAPGETKWIEGAGSHTYQTGYFGIGISDLGAGACTGTSANIYLRLNRLRWGTTIVWDYANKGIQTSNVRLSYG